MDFGGGQLEIGHPTRGMFGFGLGKKAGEGSGLPFGADVLEGAAGVVGEGIGFGGKVAGDATEGGEVIGALAGELRGERWRRVGIGLREAGGEEGGEVVGLLGAFVSRAVEEAGHAGGAELRGVEKPLGDPGGVQTVAGVVEAGGVGGPSGERGCGGGGRGLMALGALSFEEEAMSEAALVAGFKFGVVGLVDEAGGGDGFADEAVAFPVEADDGLAVGWACEVQLDGVETSAQVHGSGRGGGVCEVGAVEDGVAIDEETGLSAAFEVELDGFAEVGAEEAGPARGEGAWGKVGGGG